MAIPRFLKPLPSKVVCVGLNYHNHAKELKMKTPRHPIIFMKPVSSIIGNGDGIIYPYMSKRVDYEAELAFVISKKCKDIFPEEAHKYIKGFTCLNDVTARDLQKLDGQWTRAKSFDTFCCIGPKLVKLKEPNNVDIKCRLNGKIVQESNTSEFIFDVEEVLSFISKGMTLNKGDVVTTGTPPGVGPMKAGDNVEVSIEGIGTLKNYVK
mgnify:CR=1 FL=1